MGVAMADNGDLYAAWTTERTDSYIYWNIAAAKSSDGGSSWNLKQAIGKLSTAMQHFEKTQEQIHQSKQLIEKTLKET